MLVHSGSLLRQALCGIMWSRVMCPSSTQATQPTCPSHFRLSLLAAFPRNWPGWSTPKRFHCIRVCQQKTPDNVLEQLSFTCWSSYHLLSDLSTMFNKPDLFLVKHIRLVSCLRIFSDKCCLKWFFNQKVRAYPWIWWHFYEFRVAKGLIYPPPPAHSLSPCPDAFPLPRRASHCKWPAHQAICTLCLTVSHQWDVGSSYYSSRMTRSLLFPFGHLGVIYAP